jgi:hypothetical protein
VNTCSICSGTVTHYMVDDRLWQACGVGPYVACWECLERRMGRPIAVTDLLLCPVTAEHPKAREMILALLRRADRGAKANARRSRAERKT